MRIRHRFLQKKLVKTEEREREIDKVLVLTRSGKVGLKVIVTVFVCVCVLLAPGPSPDELEEKYAVELWDSGTEEDSHSDSIFLSISDKFLQEIDATKGEVSVARN